MLLVTKLILIFSIARAEDDEKSEWDYARERGTLDPKHWFLKYEACSGLRQSPVAIDCSHIHRDSTLKPLQFVNYDIPIDELMLYNDGHTLKVDVPQLADARLFSDSLPSAYRLKQFHFHWGTEQQGGSEHQINGKRWPLEMHLVHVNDDIPEDEVTLTNNGMVVVSVLFTYPNKRDQRKADAIEYLTSVIHDVILEGENTTLSNFIIGNLLPEGAGDNYFRYSGSLTTPPCAEVVEWIILTRTMVVTSNVMKRFRATRQRIHMLKQLQNRKAVNIKENARPLQALNDRPIGLMGNLGQLPQCHARARGNAV